MFIVSTISPLDPDWLPLEDKINKAAGRWADSIEADTETVLEHKGDLTHEWVVRNFKEAMAMKKRLSKIDNVRVTIREK